MAKQARRQLINLQRSLYEKAYRDAHTFSTGNSRSLLSYASEFERGLPTSFSRVEIEHLTKSINECQVALYGDFHTLKQSQRGLLRIIRSFRERYPKKTIRLALEAFRATDHSHIQAYQRGTLDEEAFLRKTNYHSRWGFPWAHFKMLFEFAAEHKIDVFGINCEQSGKDSLYRRDAFAAKTIIEKMSTVDPSHPAKNRQNNASNQVDLTNTVIFCLIGEHHLADIHLPLALEKKANSTGYRLKTVKILSNVDKYFFEIPNDKPARSTEYLFLKDNTFCVMNSPPWMKWQSYTVWEELRSIDEYQDFDDEAEDESELELYTEQTYDVDYHFMSIARSLAKFIEKKIDDGMLSKFSIYSNFYTEEINQIDFGKTCPNSEVERMIARASLDGVYFVSDSNVVLLNELSVNNLSEASGQFIHKILTKFSDTQGSQSEQFHRRIIKSAIGMLSSKMLNPRRKCLTIEQFEKYLSNNHRKRLSGLLKTKREAFRESIRHHAWMQSRVFEYGGVKTNLPKNFHVKDIELNYEISRSIGLLLGFRLYSLVMSNRAPGKWIHDIFLRQIESDDDAWKLLCELYQTVHCPGMLAIDDAVRIPPKK